MYKDEIWYRKFEMAVNEHKDDFSQKQWEKYHIESLLHLAKRIKDASDTCETCQEYQHTLTRLEEEILELPGSKAQRQYMLDQFVDIGRHFMDVHDLVPKQYYTRTWLRRGLWIGGLAGIVLLLFTGDFQYFFLAWIIVAGSAAAYGYAEDDKVKREHRIL